MNKEKQMEGLIMMKDMVIRKQGEVITMLLQQIDPRGIIKTELDRIREINQLERMYNKES